LGITIHGLDDEFVQPKSDEDIEWEKNRVRLKQKRDWWRANARKQNRKRRERRNGTVRAKYLTAKSLALQKGQDWEFSYEDWKDLWLSAKMVKLSGTATSSNPEGVRVTAYSKRGSNKDFNTYMQRKDLSKGWSKDNCFIVYRGRSLSD
jgi:hypothetical protein